VILVVVVCFRDEEEHLPVLLESLGAQTRPPDSLVLVDDGSTDASATIARAFADDRPWAQLLVRPPSAHHADGLAEAAELRAFQWAVTEVGLPFDVVAKLDADLQLSPDLFAAMEQRFTADPDLGIAGAQLVEVHDGVRRRLGCPPDHVQGATKFYRRACFEDIAPLPPFLGWDTIDEVRARIHGWTTATFEAPPGDQVHLRRMGTAGGTLAGYRRAGRAAYGYGSPPLVVALSVIARLRHRPYGLAAMAFLAGWVGAVLTRAPRAEPEVRDFVRVEQRRRLHALVRARE